MSQQFTPTQLAATIDQTKLLKKLGLPAPTPKPAQFADTYHLPELLLLTLERLPATVRLSYTPAPADGQPCAFDLFGVPPQPAPQPSHYGHYSPAVALASLLIDLLKRTQQPATPPAPSREELAGMFWQRFRYRLSRPDEPLVAADIKDVMEMGDSLQVQVHMRGFTDWYAVKRDAAGQLDPATIEQLPF